MTQLHAKSSSSVSYLLGIVIPSLYVFYAYKTTGYNESVKSNPKLLAAGPQKGASI
jgi:hypothetical protein